MTWSIFLNHCGSTRRLAAMMLQIKFAMICCALEKRWSCSVEATTLRWTFRRLTLVLKSYSVTATGSSSARDVSNKLSGIQIIYWNKCFVLAKLHVARPKADEKNEWNMKFFKLTGWLYLTEIKIQDGILLKDTVFFVYICYQDMWIKVDIVFELI